MTFSMRHNGLRSRSVTVCSNIRSKYSHCRTNQVNNHKELSKRRETRLKMRFIDKMAANSASVLASFKIPVLFNSSLFADNNHTKRHFSLSSFLYFSCFFCVSFNSLSFVLHALIYSFLFLFPSLPFHPSPFLSRLFSLFLSSHFSSFFYLFLVSFSLSLSPFLFPLFPSLSPALYFSLSCPFFLRHLTHHPNLGRSKTLKSHAEALAFCFAIRNVP